MPRHALVKPALGKHSERRRKMLLAVQALLLEAAELWVRADLEFLAGGGGAEGADGDVRGSGGVVDVEGGGHFEREGEIKWDRRDERDSCFVILAGGDCPEVIVDPGGL
jgi:hypothetical protein